MPNIALSQYSGGYRAKVTVRASGLVPFEMTNIYFNNGRITGMKNDASGGFSVPLEFPPPSYSYPIGTYAVELRPYATTQPGASVEYFFDGSGTPYPATPIPGPLPKQSPPAGSVDALLLLVPLAVGLVILSRRQ